MEETVVKKPLSRVRVVHLAVGDKFCKTDTDYKQRIASTVTEQTFEKNHLGNWQGYVKFNTKRIKKGAHVNIDDRIHNSDKTVIFIK